MLHIGAWEPVEHFWSDFTIENPRFRDQDQLPHPNPTRLIPSPLAPPTTMLAPSQTHPTTPSTSASSPHHPAIPIRIEQNQNTKPTFILEMNKHHKNKENRSCGDEEGEWVEWVPHPKGAVTKKKKKEKAVRPTKTKPLFRTLSFEKHLVPSSSFMYIR